MDEWEGFKALTDWSPSVCINSWAHDSSTDAFVSSSPPSPCTSPSSIILLFLSAAVPGSCTLCLQLAWHCCSGKVQRTAREKQQRDTKKKGLIMGTEVGNDWMIYLYVWRLYYSPFLEQAMVRFQCTFAQSVTSSFTYHHTEQTGNRPHIFAHIHEFADRCVCATYLQRSWVHTHTQTHTHSATIAVMEGHRLMPLESVNEMNEQGGGEFLGALGEVWMRTADVKSKERDGVGRNGRKKRVKGRLRVIIMLSGFITVP